MKTTKPQYLFVTTQHKDVAQELLDIGYQLVNQSDGVWVFMNQEGDTLSFDSNKITYTNVLNF